MGLRSALGRALGLCFLFVMNTSLWILAPALARTSIPKEIETPRLWAPRYLSLRNSCWILGELSLRPSHRPGAVPRSSAPCRPRASPSPDPGLAAPPARHSPAGRAARPGCLRSAARGLWVCFSAPLTASAGCVGPSASVSASVKWGRAQSYVPQRSSRTK